MKYNTARDVVHLALTMEFNIALYTICGWKPDPSYICTLATLILNQSPFFATPVQPIHRAKKQDHGFTILDPPSRDPGRDIFLPSHHGPRYLSGLQERSRVRMGRISRFLFRADEDHRALRLHPEILRTCNSIFEEASSILIQKNHFVYHSVRNSPNLKMSRTRRDRSWDIMLGRYHCNPPHFTSGLGSSSHRIRYLDIRLADFVDLRTVYSTLPHMLDAQNTLKTLNLELWAPWKRHYLLAFFRGISNALNCPKLTITGFRDLTYDWFEEELFRGLESIISGWNQGRDRKFVEVESELSDEELNNIIMVESVEKKVWILMP